MTESNIISTSTPNSFKIPPITQIAPNTNTVINRISITTSPKHVNEEHGRFKKIRPMNNEKMNQILLTTQQPTKYRNIIKLCTNYM